MGAEIRGLKLKKGPEVSGIAKLWPELRAPLQEVRPVVLQ
jgi:hypothetical protein